MSRRRIGVGPVGSHYPMKLLGIVWASPNTLLGLFIGTIGLAFGSKGRFVEGAFEFHSGLIRWLLRKVPGPAGGAAAMTIGHVILGLDQLALDSSRVHEHVHVRQYERW